MRGRTVVVGAMVVLAACGGEGAAGPSMGSPSDIAAALQKSGLGCTDYSSTPQGQMEMDVNQQGACTADGENATLYTFRDSGQRDNWVGAAGTLGCSVGKAFGLTSLNLVLGPNWAIGMDSATGAGHVAAKIGGTVKTIHCS